MAELLEELAEEALLADEAPLHVLHAIMCSKLVMLPQDMALLHCHGVNKSALSKEFCSASWIQVGHWNPSMVGTSTLCKKKSCA